MFVNISFDGEPKEIADLVREIQDRQSVPAPLKFSEIDPSKPRLGAEDVVEIKER